MTGRTLASALRNATARIAAVSDTPRLDAELLAAHALRISRDRMLLDGLDRRPAPDQLDALIERRLGHEPIAYILGRRAFWTIELAVGPGVLVPRADSETLIEAAVAHFAGTVGPRRILDLGTGSGALLLAALDQWPGASGVGIDALPAALDWARTNAEALGFDGRSELRLGDWAGTGEPFDLVLCNPPYVESGAALPPEVRDHEPASALFAGADGLDDYRRIAPLLGRQIEPGGAACVEIGWTQAAEVTALFRVEDMAAAVRCDLSGRDRCLLITRDFALGKQRPAD